MPDNHINYKDIPDDELIILLAKECYQIYGFYPISFSYHSEINNEIPKKERLCSGGIKSGNHTPRLFKSILYSRQKYILNII